MKYAKFAAVLALFAAMGCSSENPVSDPEAQMTAFTGQFSGKNQTTASASLLAPCSGDLISLNLAGTGQFTQIGATAVELAHCGRPEPVSSNPTMLEVLYGKIVLAGTNGDKIHLDYEGNVVHSAKITLNGKFSITGGTGRFIGAHGNGAFVCEMTGPDNEFVADLKGEISSSRDSSN